MTLFGHTTRLGKCEVRSAKCEVVTESRGAGDGFCPAPCGEEMAPNFVCPFSAIESAGIRANGPPPPTLPPPERGEEATTAARAPPPDPRSRKRRNPAKVFEGLPTPILSAPTPP